jgi:hypothetical protein
VKVAEGINLALRFILELSALAALGYWGYETGSGVMRWVLTIAAPLVAALVWALFVSPKATIELARPARLVLELGVFGAAAAALAVAGHGSLAVLFAAVALVSGTLSYVWD